MQAIWMNNSLCLVPETVEELRSLLAEHEGEAYCEDCEATVEPDADLCPTCGEGIGCEPEYRPVRPVRQH
jgi:predicted amidophosphoribosyltransferase